MPNTLRTSRVILAGAGPGDPDLISLKALKAIQHAEVILYDALVNTSLLTHAQKDCKLIYVGKRKGTKAFSQEEINQLLVVCADQYKEVLRLKGGDPYVFGRGHEELMYLMNQGIHTEVIPGISSALAAPASVGIPVTKRGVNESFWVVTGMLASGTFSKDLRLAAQSSATVIILMGITHIDEMMRLFSLHRSSNEPVAVIHNACTPKQLAIKGTVRNIAQLTREKGITSPAVIVVGDVVHESMLEEIMTQPETLLKLAV
ncbi:MAG TPA: uroporphyrinogen-III C-methyltransferase [Ohtaekwangia sp.]|nr:uroporphyrinogen-III C-methyltransferase [Ohtaekwangia sp.]